MRIHWIAALLFVGGCHVESTTMSSSGTEGSNSPTETKAEAPTVRVEAPSKEVDVPQLKASDNPNRVYQLRDLQITKLTANGHTIDTWVMDTSGKRAEGMMFLKPKEIKDSQGMIFLFAGEQTKEHAFWMKDTHTPLDIIYIGNNKKVISIGKGDAFNETPVYPLGPYQYVLELKQGVSKKLGIKPGTPISIPSNLKADE